MARTRQPAPMTLEGRLAADLLMTGGRMPIGVIVAAEAERALALKWLAGRKHARLLTVRTAAEAGRR